MYSVDEVAIYKTWVTTMWDLLVSVVFYLWCSKVEYVLAVKSYDNRCSNI